MGTSLRRALSLAAVVGLLLGGWLGWHPEAQPFSAEITRALRAVGLSGAPGVWTVPIKAPDGAVGAPAYTFSSDPDTGMYWDGTANRISFATGGNQTIIMGTSFLRINSNTGTLEFGTAADTTLVRGGAAGKLQLTGTTPMLLMGGATSSFPTLKRNAAGLEARLADDSAGTTITGTDFITAAGSMVAGVASGYKVARGSTALDGSNPTTVATGLTTVVSCTGDLRRNTALTSGTAFLTHDAPSGANVDFYGWVLAGTASTGTETFDWICVGT